MVFHFTKMNTVARYDWVVTTPIMLITYSMYCTKKEALPDLYDAVEQNKTVLGTIDHVIFWILVRKPNRDEIIHLVWQNNRI